MKTLRVTLCSAVVALVVIGGYQLYLRSKALAALPESVGVEGTREIRIVPGFPQWLAFGSSGYFVYQLDEKTSQSLLQSGLSYLNASSPKPRALNGASDQRLQYLPWNASPLPPELTTFTSEGRGLWSGLVHAQFSPEFESQVLASAKEPGSFYTANGHGDILVVIPRLRIAIFSWVQ